MLTKMWSRRSIDTHIKTTTMFVSSFSSAPRSLFKTLQPCFTSSSRPSIRFFSSSKTLTSPKRFFFTSSFSFSFSTSKTLNLNPTSNSSTLFVVVRSLSSASSQHLFEFNEPPQTAEVSDGFDFEEDDDDDADDVAKVTIPVRAYFVSTSVDLRSLIDHNKTNFIPPTSRMTNYVVLRFRGNNNMDASILDVSLNASDFSYMVVFQYGSIVLFNIHDHEIDGYLKIVQRHASALLPEMRKDEYEVREKPSLNTWMQSGLDYIMLQHLDIDGIRTIGSVLGQSIALDYYVRQVDGMVAEFTDINRGMEKTGTFTMERKKLFQLVGKANSNLADVILKLGLFERSDIAWKDAKYAQIWEYLRDEFELTQRFASLDFKLKFVEHNIRFLQEILQNRKSDFLEWLIIILIAAEILISVYDIAHRSVL